MYTWLKNNIIGIAIVIIAAFAYLGVVVLGTFLALFLFGMPLRFNIELFMLALIIGFIDRRAVKSSELVRNKLTDLFSSTKDDEDNLDV